MLRSPLIAPAAQDEVATLFVGFELSKKTWLIGLYAPELGKTISRHKIDGGDVDAALELFGRLPPCLSSRLRLAGVRKGLNGCGRRPDRNFAR